MAKERGTVAKKIHRVRSVSKCHPPPNAPDWTLNNDYILSEGTFIIPFTYDSLFQMSIVHEQLMKSTSICRGAKTELLTFCIIC